MDNKITRFLLPIFIFFFVFSSSIFGFEIKTEFDVMGSSCGIPDSNINKCCTAPSIHFNLKTGNVLIDTPLTPIRVPIEILLNAATYSLPNQIKQLSDKYLGKSAVCYPNSTPSTSDPNNPDCICVASESAGLTASIDLCNMISNSTEKNSCLNCVQGSNAGIWTGLGCVYSDIGTFIEKTLLGWGIGLAGITALLCIIYSTFQMQTSQGNPEKIKKAQELLTSCIMGLMLIIFSIFILKLIGVNILKIPGFGG